MVLLLKKSGRDLFVCTDIFARPRWVEFVSRQVKSMFTCPWWWVLFFRYLKNIIIHLQVEKLSGKWKSVALVLLDIWSKFLRWTLKVSLFLCVRVLWFAAQCFTVRFYQLGFCPFLPVQQYQILLLQCSQTTICPIDHCTRQWFNLQPRALSCLN